MSYVRWSSDDFQSDVYCYESAEGFVTHVAVKRYHFVKPFPPPIGVGEPGWAEREKKVMRRVARAKTISIGGPHDGESFVDPTEHAMKLRLIMLKNVGYHVPAGVIEALE